MTKGKFLDGLAYAILALITLAVIAVVCGGVGYVAWHHPAVGAVIGGLFIVWVALGWALKRVS